MPSLDQSGTRHVGFVLSKIFTPLHISSKITVLDSSNSFCRVSSHWNGVSGLSRERKGDIRSVMLNVYATWLIIPNQLLISVMFWGVGKLLIARRYFWPGRTLSRVTSNPANSTVSAPNMNFSELRVMPLLPHKSSHSVAWWKLASRYVAHNRVSSIHLVLFGTSETISSKRHE